MVCENNVCKLPVVEKQENDAAAEGEKSAEEKVQHAKELLEMQRLVKEAEEKEVSLFICFLWVLIFYIIYKYLFKMCLVVLLFYFDTSIYYLNYNECLERKTARNRTTQGGPKRAELQEVATGAGVQTTDGAEGT